MEFTLSVHHLIGCVDSLSDQGDSDQFKEASLEHPTSRNHYICPTSQDRMEKPPHRRGHHQRSPETSVQKFLAQPGGVHSGKDLRL